MKGNTASDGVIVKEPVIELRQDLGASIINMTFTYSQTGRTGNITLELETDNLVSVTGQGRHVFLMTWGDKRCRGRGFHEVL